MFYSSEHFDSVLATVYMFLSASATPRASLPSTVGDDAGNSFAAMSTGVSKAAAAGTSGGAASGPCTTSCAASRCGDDVDGSDTAAAVTRGGATLGSIATSRPASGDGDDACGPSTTSNTARGSIRSIDDVADFHRGVANNAVVTHAATTRARNTAAVTAAAGNCSTNVVNNDDDCSSNKKPVFLTAYHERSARRSLRPLLRKWGMAARVLHDLPREVLPCDLWESGVYDSVALLEITLL